MDIQTTKLELIRMVMETENRELLAEIWQMCKRAIKENGGDEHPANVAEPEPEWLTLAKQPMPDDLDIDAIAEEQGYSAEKLFETLRNLDRSVFEDEPLEELLNALTK